VFVRHPLHPELALGALTEFGEVYWNPEFESHPQRYGLSPQSRAVQRVVEAEKKEAERRKRVYRGHMPGLQLQGKTVILVDDGVAVSAAKHSTSTRAGRAEAG
jgi:putative phosphoribosyl transferase